MTGSGSDRKVSPELEKPPEEWKRSSGQIPVRADEQGLDGENPIVSEK